MNNPVYDLMLYNIREHCSNPDDDSYNAFILTSVLAILVNKSKEDVMKDYLNYINKGDL